MACAPAAPAPPATAPPRTVEVAPPPEPTSADDPVELASSPPSLTVFADSPLTPFANDVTALAFAVLDGRALPSSDIPLERYDSSRPLLSVEPGTRAPRSAELSVLAFALELEANLPASKPNAPIARLKALAFLSREGLKLAALEKRSPSDLREIPPFLTGAGAFMSQVLRAARTSSWSTIFVGEAERRMLADENLWHEIEEERPKPAELDVITRLAQSSGTPTQYGFDDMGVLARHRDGTLWTLQLDMDRQDDKIVLDTHPLVRVRRFTKEDDEPPPEPAP